MKHLEKIRILPPLRADHPSVTEGHACEICERAFQAGERTILLPKSTAREAGKQEGQWATVEAAHAHATCGLRFRIFQSPDGPAVCWHVCDGDGSPFPVRTFAGKQYKTTECEFYQ